MEKIEHAAERPSLPTIGSLDIADLFALTTNTGVPLGPTAHPGPGWHRLHWSTLAKRMGVPLTLDDNDAVFEPTKSGNWPINIAPPGEGALDREQHLSASQGAANVVAGERA